MKDYHQILTDFYRLHNPAKIRDVGSLLAKYRGNEEELLASLKKKYGAAGSDKNYRQIITDLYRQHNPDKLSQVDTLLEKYAGNEEALVDSLKKKYQGAAPSSSPSSPSYQQPAAQAAPPVAAASEPQSYRAIITEIYRRHSPEKLSLVDSLLEKYAGSEQALIESLKKKYKDAPVVSATQPTAKATTQAAAPAEGAKDYRAIITEIFNRYDPRTAGEVDAMLSKYRGQEDVLVQYLKRKYEQQAAPARQPEADAQSATASRVEAEPVYKESETEPVEEEQPLPQPPLRTEHRPQRQPSYEPARKLSPAEERVEYWRKMDERRRREKERQRQETEQPSYFPMKETEPSPSWEPLRPEAEEVADEPRKSMVPKALVGLLIALLLGGYAFFFINGTIRSAIFSELGLAKSETTASSPTGNEAAATGEEDAGKKVPIADKEDEQADAGTSPGEGDDYESTVSATIEPPCYIIVCGLFSRKENAMDEAKRLSDMDLSAGYYFVPDYEPNGKQLYAVYAGSYKSRQSAEEELALVRRYKRDAVVKYLNGATTIDQKRNDVPLNLPMIEFTYQKVSQDQFNPKIKVFLDIGTQRFLVDQESVPQITKKNLNKHRELAGCTSWYAGFGADYWASFDNSGINIFKQIIEEHSSNISPRVIKKISFTEITDGDEFKMTVEQEFP